MLFYFYSRLRVFLQWEELKRPTPQNHLFLLRLVSLDFMGTLETEPPIIKPSDDLKSISILIFIQYIDLVSDKKADLWGWSGHYESMSILWNYWISISYWIVIGYWISISCQTSIGYHHWMIGVRYQKWPKKVDRWKVLLQKGGALNWFKFHNTTRCHQMLETEPSNINFSVRNR